MEEFIFISEIYFQIKLNMRFLGRVALKRNPKHHFIHLFNSQVHSQGALIYEACIKYMPGSFA